MVVHDLNPTTQEGRGRRISVGLRPAWTEKSHLKKHTRGHTDIDTHTHKEGGREGKKWNHL